MPSHPIDIQRKVIKAIRVPRDSVDRNVIADSETLKKATEIVNKMRGCSGLRKIGCALGHNLSCRCVSSFRDKLFISGLLDVKTNIALPFSLHAVGIRSGDCESLKAGVLLSKIGRF